MKYSGKTPLEGWDMAKNTRLLKPGAVKPGAYLNWDCMGDAKRGAKTYLLAPCRVVAVRGRKVDIEGQSMTGFGMWKRTVGIGELVR